MSTYEAAGFGEVLRRTFRVDEAPAIVARSLRDTQIAVTQIDCRAAATGLSDPIPVQDAFLIAVHLRDCPAHDMFFDGRQIETGPLKAGATCIYDLRSKPQANSINPFHHLTFHLPRASLDAIVETEELVDIDTFDHDPGFGIDDPVLHGLARCLLSALRDPVAISPLYVDHLTTAAVAHVVKRYGAKRRTERLDKLTPEQLSSAQQFLRANLSGKLTLVEVASSSGLPPLEFTRAFKRSLGMSIHQWLVLERREATHELYDERLGQPPIKAML